MKQAMAAAINPLSTGKFKKFCTEEFAQKTALVTVGAYPRAPDLEEPLSEVSRGR